VILLLSNKYSFNSNNTNATASVNSLQSQINAISSPDLTPYITTAEEQVHITDLQNQVNASKGDILTLLLKLSY
jgi:hypothetical protein